MLDRDRIEQLFADYAWPLDSREFERLRDVFAGDAAFTVAIAGGDTYGPIEGREAIYEFVSGTVGEQTDQRRHVITNLRAGDTSGDEVDVTATLTLVVVAEGRLEVKTTGVYRGTVVEEAGVARFRRLELTLDLPF